MKIFIDGGGTSSKVFLKNDFETKIIFVGGRMSLSAFEKESLENLKEIIYEIISKNNIQEIESFNIGFPGFINYDSDKIISFLKKEISEKFISDNNIKIMTDIELQIKMLIEDDKDFIYIASGTGSVAVENNNGTNILHGGWGHFLGDEGSAYDFALEWIKNTLVEWEKNRNKNIFSKLLCDFFKIDNPSEIVFIYSKPDEIKQLFSKFSLYILSDLRNHLEDEEKAINKIMEIIANKFCSYLERVISLSKYQKVYLYGGIFKNKHYHKYFENFFLLNNYKSVIKL